MSDHTSAALSTARVIAMPAAFQRIRRVVVDREPLPVEPLTVGLGVANDAEC